MEQSLMVAILRRPYHAIQNSLPVAIKVPDGPGGYVCVCSIMAMQSMGMDRYNASANYILLCCTFSDSEANYARPLPNAQLNIRKKIKDGLIAK